MMKVLTYSIPLILFVLSAHANVVYVINGNTERLDPSQQDDAQALGNSIEFETFEITEDKTSHSIYESGAGVCRGYASEAGVELTDSTTYQVDKNKNDYYARISGATLSKDKAPQNMRYAPVFNIDDPVLSQKIQEKEELNGHTEALQNINEKGKILSDGVCKGG
ncbi:hypothetical protein RYD26_06920 [Pasteurellaceae bacterium LIM206]|nr:hypothetical protein [Pasteurellaceae bacterium LIM206]